MLLLVGSQEAEGPLTLTRVVCLQQGQSGVREALGLPPPMTRGRGSWRRWEQGRAVDCTGPAAASLWSGPPSGPWNGARWNAELPWLPPVLKPLALPLSLAGGSGRAKLCGLVHQHLILGNKK